MAVADHTQTGVAHVRTTLDSPLGTGKDLHHNCRSRYKRANPPCQRRHLNSPQAPDQQLCGLADGFCKRNLYTLLDQLRGARRLRICALLFLRPSSGCCGDHLHSSSFGEAFDFQEVQSCCLCLLSSSGGVSHRHGFRAAFLLVVAALLCLASRLW